MNPLDAYIEDEQKTDGRPVPNLFPRLTNSPNRIAVIGEAPGADEVEKGEPFVGMSGRLLTGLLSKAGLVRDCLFLGNICQHRPPSNDISKFTEDLDGQIKIQEGLEKLSADLQTFNPNICLLLGKTALWAANGQTKIGDWRGSIFIGDRGPFFGRKCIATYHPAACLRQYDWTPLLMFDIKKAAKHSTTNSFLPPQRDLIINLSIDKIVDRLNDIYENKRKVSVDIEGYVHAMSCISFAPSATSSFIVPFSTRDGRNLYPTTEDEAAVWRAMARVLEDSSIPKVFQNGLYDTFVLQYSYGICVRDVVDDTMVKHWELYCELEKSLGFLCSIYTDEPYYKQDRKSDDRDVFWRYCCNDSAVTFEISDHIEKYLDGGRKEHYRFNIELLNVFRYMEMRGLKYNTTLAAERLNSCNQRYYELQHELDIASGRWEPSTRQQMLDDMTEAMCYKKDRQTPKKEFVEVFPRLKARLLDPTPLDNAALGEWSIECGFSLNIKSIKFKKYIYEDLKLPIQYDPKTGAPTTDFEALLRIQKKKPTEVIRLATEIGSIRTRSQMLAISADPDGRIRCGYNEVGAATGRITCYTSPTGSGYNLQTLPDEDPLKAEGHPLRWGMRDLIIADEGCYLLKCDLKGADGWTVGAHCAAAGDRMMLDDLLFGIKPAQILCYMMRHGHGAIMGRSRAELKVLLAEVKKDDWDYFAFKQCIWGFCYLMGPRKAADHVFVLSEGKVDYAESDMREAKRLLFLRYNVPLWWRETERILARKPELTSASGHRRRFFGRSTETLGEALAHEPQANTTYATNKAAWRLWHDSDNRRPEYRAFNQEAGRPNDEVVPRIQLRIEPVHQVHDELLTQTQTSDIEWATGKIKSYFANPLIIAGMQITIPFEGQYGTDWAMNETSKKGSF